MEVNLTAKAKKLYAYIQEKGGGVLGEWRMRDKTGMSHGSFCAARKELVAAGLLLLGKDVRKTTYTLQDLTSQKLTCQKLTCQPQDSSDLTCQKSPLTPIKAAIPPPPPVSAVRGKKARRRKRAGRRAAKPSAEVQEAIMPRVTGDFPDFDNWILALNDTLGACVDVSQSLVDEREYIVFADEFGEDTYTVRENEDGGISVE